jgi:Ion channel
VLWLKVAAGAVIVLFALHEMFNDLFHPTESGALSEWIGCAIFRLCRFSKWMLTAAGPLSVVVSILTWALMLAVGFALIYWACFPDAYSVEPAAPHSPGAKWWWSLYYSLEMMTTLGLGDIRPNPAWLKLLSAFHTLLGFSFVTASITWIVLIFPALRRVRTLSRKAITLSDAEGQTGVPVISRGMHVVLAGLAEEVIQTRVDLIHFPILFYFYAQDPRASLPRAVFPLMRFAADGMLAERDELVRLSATALNMALADLSELVGKRLDCTHRPPEAIFREFAHLHSPRAS